MWESKRNKTEKNEEDIHLVVCRLLNWTGLSQIEIILAT